MLLIGLILSIFFILVIVLLCKTYTKDIFELENRVLQLEKRINECENKLNHEEDINNIIKQLEDNSKQWERYMTWMSFPDYSSIDKNGIILGKEGDGKMACKGKGGKKK